jgi:hypothetical protein
MLGSRYRCAYAERYSDTCVAEGKTGVLGGQAKSEKETVYLDRFVDIEGRQKGGGWDQMPPMVRFASKIRGDNWHPGAPLQRRDLRVHHLVHFCQR